MVYAALEVHRGEHGCLVVATGAEENMKTGLCLHLALAIGEEKLLPFQSLFDATVRVPTLHPVDHLTCRQIALQERVSAPLPFEASPSHIFCFSSPSKTHGIGLTQGSLVIEPADRPQAITDGDPSGTMGSWMERELQRVQGERPSQL